MKFGQPTRGNGADDKYYVHDGDARIEVLLSVGIHLLHGHRRRYSALHRSCADAAWQRSFRNHEFNELSPKVFAQVLGHDYGESCCDAIARLGMHWACVATCVTTL